MELLGVKVAYEDIESEAGLTPWPAVRPERDWKAWHYNLQLTHFGSQQNQENYIATGC